MDYIIIFLCFTTVIFFLISSFYRHKSNIYQRRNLELENYSKRMRDTLVKERKKSSSNKPKVKRKRRTKKAINNNEILL